jgi:hypothetical protein
VGATALFHAANVLLADARFVFLLHVSVCANAAAALALGAPGVGLVLLAADMTATFELAL